jgi:hypothetical protein
MGFCVATMTPTPKARACFISATSGRFAGADCAGGATKAVHFRCHKTSEFWDQGLTVAQQQELAEFVTDTEATFDPAASCS